MVWGRLTVAGNKVYFLGATEGMFGSSINSHSCDVGAYPEAVVCSCSQPGLLSYDPTDVTLANQTKCSVVWRGDDADCDGVTNKQEGGTDTDRDGIPDALERCVLIPKTPLVQSCPQH